jgi:hypothetical protein
LTNAEIFTQFENFIDDAPDRTLEVQLANMAKGKLEAELKLAITKKVDTSLISTVGGTYLTSYTLPTDMFTMFDYLYVGTAVRTGIPFDQRLTYKDDSSKFYVDLAQNNLYLCGTVASAETISIPYIYETTDIADDAATVVVWPERFHMLIPMQMAILWPAIEGGDKNRSWAPEWSAFYNQLKNSLIDWDHSWKLSAIGGATPYGSDSVASENRINP